MTGDLSAALDEIRRRAEAATRGPWEAEDDEDCWRLFGAVTPGLHPLQLIKAPKRDTPFAEYWPSPADAEFIAHARTDVPALAAALEAVLALTVKWDQQAKRFDNRADKTDGDQAANLYYRAQMHQDNAEAVREAVEAALRDAQGGAG